jgi:glycosyltransferase involved in cell wall biosynthesis
MPPRPAATGAIPLVLWGVLEALRDKHQITLLTLAGPDPAEHDAVTRLRDEGIEVHAVARRAPGPVGRAARYLQHAGEWVTTALPMRAVWFRERDAQETIDRVLGGAPRFDVVQVEDNAMGGYHFPRVAPLLYTEHEVRTPRRLDWSRALSRRPLRDALDELDWQRWERYQRGVWRKFDRIQAFTTRDAERIQALAPDVAGRVSVNPFGIALPPVADLSLEEPGHLVFVGQYLHQPNVDAAHWLARDILPRVKRVVPGARLSLVGHDPEGRLRTLGGNGVTVCGFVPSLERVVERAAVLVAPMRTGGGQRMKVLHGMARGKAVVTTTRGALGIADGAGEAPIVIADDAATFAERVVDLLGDTGMRRSLGRRARAFAAERHGPDAYGRRLEALYEEMVAVWRPGRTDVIGAR